MSYTRHKNTWCANDRVGAGMIPGACPGNASRENFQPKAAATPTPWRAGHGTTQHNKSGMDKLLDKLKSKKNSIDHYKAPKTLGNGVGSPAVPGHAPPSSEPGCLTDCYCGNNCGNNGYSCDTFIEAANYIADAMRNAGLEPQWTDEEVCDLLVSSIGSTDEDSVPFCATGCDGCTANGLYQKTCAPFISSSAGGAESIKKLPKNSVFRKLMTGQTKVAKRS